MDIVRQCSHSRGEPLRVVRQLALCSAIHCHPAVVDVLRPWAHRGYVYGLKPNASDSADKRRSIRTTYSYPACAIPVATNASAVARTSASVTPHLQSVPATLQCQQHLKRAAGSARGERRRQSHPKWFQLFQPSCTRGTVRAVSAQSVQSAAAIR